MTTILASPNQASRLLGLDGSNPVRPKGLFYVRFDRPAASRSDVPLGFIAKSVDRPVVQPQVEEINQYNRKRLIHTGVKYAPINITFYDTADTMAMQMFDAYAGYHFGDFGQDTGSYMDDILAPTMLDTGTGYGFHIRPTTTTDKSGVGSQNFFTACDIYQVYGAEFTQITLINPRITAYEPESLDYEDFGPSMIRMTLQFEAVKTWNGGVPQMLAKSSELLALFDNNSGPFGGQVVDVSSEPNAAVFAGVNIDGVSAGLSISANGISGGISIGGLSISGSLGANGVATGTVGAYGISVTGSSAVSDPTLSATLEGVLSPFGDFTF